MSDVTDDETESDNSLNDRQQMEDDLLMANSEPLADTARPGSGVPLEKDPEAPDSEIGSEPTDGTRQTAERTLDEDSF